MYCSREEVLKNLQNSEKLIFETEEYFFDEYRFQQLREAIHEGKIVLDHTETTENKKFGTVGAVAKDVHGNLAAGTSTGGMTNKRFNRIGDSPIIGSGTYATMPPVPFHVRVTANTLLERW